MCHYSACNRILKLYLQKTVQLFQEALVLGKEDESRLIRNRRLVLLVDLDQTLIHTTNENIAPNIKDVYHFQVTSIFY